MVGLHSVAWFKTGVTTSFGKVRLKHRELLFDSSTKAASLETLEKAFTAIRNTIGWLAHPKAQRLQDAMLLYFKVPAGQVAHRAVKVHSVLELVQNGMRSGKLDFKTDNTSKRRFQGAFDVDREEAENIEGYVRGVGSSQVGNIHVTRDYVLNNRFQAVRTFIHEATHRFASTEDFDEAGYMKSDGSDFRAPGLTMEQALNNADSYAYFCMRMGYT